MKNEERREKNESAREREVGGEEDWEVWRPLIFFSVAAFLHSLSPFTTTATTTTPIFPPGTNKQTNNTRCRPVNARHN